MKLYWGAEVKIYIYLRIALDGEEWSALHTGRFSSEERILGIAGIEEWKGLKTALNVVTKNYNATIPYWHRSLYCYMYTLYWATGW
jgi:hypothetical protein